MRDDIFIPFWLAALLIAAFFIGGFLLGIIYSNWGQACL